MKRTVIFAEPVTGNTNKQLDAALLPGDRLLEVNGQNVQNTNREDIIDIIRNSGSTVTLKVGPFIIATSLNCSRETMAAIGVDNVGMAPRFHCGYTAHIPDCLVDY